MNEKTKTRRRTHYQALARKKYRRMRFLGGDGEWVVLSKCYELWTYKLAGDQFDAAIEANRSCGPECTKQHRVWRMIEQPKAKPLEQKPVEVKPAARLEPAPDDEQSLFWENRMGVDGL